MRDMAAKGSTANGRLEWIDLARATAILFVVLCHACEGLYSFELESIFKYSLGVRIFALGVHTVGRWGVPLFLMISGYLLLDRPYDGDRCAHFWKNNWLRLVICLAIWIVINDVYQLLVEHVPISITGIIGKELYMMNTSNMGHMWYMPMIIGLYLMLPFIANGLRSIDIRYLRMPVIIYGIVMFAYPVLGVVTKSLGIGGYGQQLSAGFSGGIYGIYMILGYMAKKGEFRRIPGMLLGMLLALSIAGEIVLQLFAYGHGYYYAIWYNDLFLVLGAGCLFELFSRLRRVAWPNFVGFLARYSFAVYLIHNLISRFMCRVIGAQPWAHWLKLAAQWSIVAVSSYLLAAALSRIPKLGKYLLYVK